MEQNFFIRMAELEDAERLLEIYRPYVENTAISFEYEVPSVEEFRGRIERILQKYPYLVVVADEQIVGYAYAAPFIQRAAYDWSVELTIYLDQNQKGNGYGSALYQEMEKRLRQQHVLNMNSCIAYTDCEDEHLTNASMHFHERMGFQLVGKFTNSGYKFKKWYDMIWMEKLIGEHVAEPEKVVFLRDLKGTL